MEQDQLYEMLVQKDEITWKSIIYDLIKSEQMNPWDINISLLAKKYMDAIKNLEEHNFFISGKVILASAMLLKMKSVKLVTENIADFDNQLFQQDEDLLDEEEGEFREEINKEYPNLLVKTPQARKRKVTLNDLMFALEKALEVDDRRKVRREGEKLIRPVELPKKKIDITVLIKDLYGKIMNFFKKREEITFDELLPSEDKMDKILTFLPLLHLSNEGKVDVNQEKSFGEIKIKRGYIDEDSSSD
jgi:segregation and condensation protein A